MGSTMKTRYHRSLLLPISIVFLTACGSETEEISMPNSEQVSPVTLSDQLREVIVNTTGTDAAMLLMPYSDDYQSIPSDPTNQITEEKVALGKMLFHDTALATEGVHSALEKTWSCASCHHAAAGFKSGIVQGIGEGGSGFGLTGETRVLANGFDAQSENPSMIPDVQPFTSPAVLNAAYQEVMLWNGQFGNQIDGNVNKGLPNDILASPNTPKKENLRALSGLETQAIAGTAVHRLNTSENSILQSNTEYQLLFDAAFPEGSNDILEDAGKAIAAYERTILANEAPFQRWLAGDESAMTDQELRGAVLFFGKAQCAGCHTGPALSSAAGATEREMFMAVGFADLDTNLAAVTGEVSNNDAKGRGGFTGDASYDYTFKVPQLYNLKDTDVYGHGGSFSSIRQVVAYKNTAVSQKRIPMNQLDARFIPLGLSSDEIDDLVAFLEEGLYDANLQRYVPDALPSGACFPDADEQSVVDLNC